MKICVTFFIYILTLNHALLSLPHYYCAPSDAKHYHLLKNLIGSIHKNDWKNTEEIMVFDLGMTKAQLSDLNKMKKVKVYNPEITHKNLLTPLLTHANGRKVRGYFAWKPVMIKQALEKYPYVLYLDGGSTVLQPLDNLFKHISQNGYYLMTVGHHSIEERITKPVIDEVIRKFDATIQKKLMSPTTYMIDAGMQGLSRAIYTDYVIPNYNASYDLNLFKDDGSARIGYGEGRHDQTIFSIYAHALNLHINPQGWQYLSIDALPLKTHIHWHPKEININTIIYRSRHDIHYNGGHTQFIKYNK
jgi:hypothetical protein